MKKLISLIAVCLVLVTTVSAQDQAIGLRLGGGGSFDGEISYQRKLTDANRLELDLGFLGNSDYSGFALTGIYQWVWELNDLTEGFGWFAGVGGGLRAINGYGIGLGINGQIGIEYSIPNIPLKLSLDARPGWYTGGIHTSGYGVVLGVRYLF